MAMGACPGQIPMPCVPPALMVTATMVRACRYISSSILPRMKTLSHCNTFCEQIHDTLGKKSNTSKTHQFRKEKAME